MYNKNRRPSLMPLFITYIGILLFGIFALGIASALGLI